MDRKRRCFNLFDEKLVASPVLLLLLPCKRVQTAKLAAAIASGLAPRTKLLENEAARTGHWFQQKPFGDHVESRGSLALLCLDVEQRTGIQASCSLTAMPCAISLPEGWQEGFRFLDRQRQQQNLSLINIKRCKDS